MPFRFLPKRWGSVFEAGLGAVTLTHAEPGEVNISPVDNYYGVIFLAPQPRRVTSVASSRKAEFSAPAGALEIVPANSDYFAQWSATKTSVAFGADRKAIENLAEMDFDRSLMELRPPVQGTRDETAYQIAKMMQAELSSPDDINKLYIESLINVYWIHLLKNYSSISKAQDNRTYSALSPHIWNRVEEYMRENISNQISLQDMASLCNLSLSHFRRSFQRTVNMPPHQYLIKLRISAAERLLVETDLPLALVAQRCGFASQSHLTRAMQQWRGITPGYVRKLQSE